MYLGLDFGDKTIGVAVSAPGARVALGVETLRRPAAEALRVSLRRLDELVKRYRATVIVLGYPKHMDGTPSPRCGATLAFRDRLLARYAGVETVLWDERLSTRAVTRARPSGGARDAADEMAAVYILQGYLDCIQTAMKARKEFTAMRSDDDLYFSQPGIPFDKAVTLYDDDGNASEFEVLAYRKQDGALYLLAAEINPDGAGEAVTEVLHFKSTSADEDDINLEVVDDEHEEYAAVKEMFRDDYQKLGIETED